MKTILLWAAVLLTARLLAAPPNIVVIMGDDWSWPHAGILGDPIAKTPTFDRIAREGVLFENAFTTAPSCTPSRFAVATGQHHWRLGQGKSLGGSLTPDVPVYGDLMKEAGYEVGFSRKGAAPSRREHRDSDPFGKKHPNFDAFLDASKKGSPFCFWYGAGEPHRPYEFNASTKEKSGIDLSAIPIPAGLPDNPTVRADLGDYYLRVAKLDRLAGEIVARLEKDGLLEETIVVMAGDNGMPFPGCKATLHDLGTRVPLAIRWGNKVKGGAKVTPFVILADLAPTFLEAAKLPIPSEMSANSLFPHLIEGRSGTSRDHALLAMEQHVYPWPQRGIRTKDHLYIRNLSPSTWKTGARAETERSYDFEKTPWPTEPGAFSFNIDPSPTKQWLRQNDPSHPAFGVRPEEELYDLTKDPGQLVNLADNSAYAEIRNQLSARLTNRFRETGDPRFELPSHTRFPVHGFTIHLHDELWADQPAKTKAMLPLLGEQLQRVAEAVPKDALARLRKKPIWINPTPEGFRPRAEYHPGAQWLRDNGRNPDMVHCVEVTNVENFAFECKRMPYLMLHELAHAYHHQVLGWDRADVAAAFKEASASGKYDKVKRFTGRDFKIDRAYALSNEMEYFAELTEAYFGKNDFFPFDRAELEKHDPVMFELLPRLWGVR